MAIIIPDNVTMDQMESHLTELLSDADTKGTAWKASGDRKVWIMIYRAHYGEYDACQSALDRLQDLRDTNHRDNLTIDFTVNEGDVLVTVWKGHPE